MATPTPISNMLLTAELKTSNLTDANIIALQGGAFKVGWNTIKNGTRAINAVSRQVNLGDYSSPQFLIAYSCLSDFVGIYAGGVIDPNAQIPGTTIITVPVLQNFNNDKIPFLTTDGSPQLILANYNLNYAPLYGNNPNLEIYITTDDYTGDLQTPPTLTYSTPGDEMSNITQILWDYPVATSGYLQISGIGTASSGTPSGGGGVTPLPFYFTQDDLNYDSVLDQYYIHLILPGTRRPFYASINGDSIPLNYSASTSRFSGFANNLPTQNIEIDLM